MDDFNIPNGDKVVSNISKLASISAQHYNGSSFVVNLDNLSIQDYNNPFGPITTHNLMIEQWIQSFWMDVIHCLGYFLEPTIGQSASP